MFDTRVVHRPGVFMSPNSGRHGSQLLLASILVVIAFAPAFAQAPPVVPPGDYVIGADDVLGVVFWKEPDISAAHVRVRPDGKISIPLLGEVSAAGLSPDELKRQLETIAKPFFADVTATVMVNDINSRKVFITGAVAQPGGFRINGPQTGLQGHAPSA